MKRYLLCLAILFVQVIARGDTIDVDQLPQKIKLAKLKDIQVSEIPLSDTYKTPIQLNFSPYQKSYKTKSKKAYWLRFTIKNNLVSATSLYINNIPCDYTFLYRQKGQKLIKIATAGRLVPNHKLSIKGISTILPISLASNETTTFYLLAYNAHLDNTYLNFFLIKQPDLIFQYYRSDLSETVVTLFFLGAFSFLSLFTLFMYYKSRHRIYLFYSLYLIGAILYSLTRLSPTTLLGAWLCNFPMWRILFNEPAQFLFFACYNFFVIELLDIKKQDPLLSKILKNLAFGYLIYAIFFYLFSYFYFHAGVRILFFNVHRFVLFPINILLLIRFIYTIKSPVLSYFISGVAIFMLSSILAVFAVVFLRSNYQSEPIRAINIFQIGLMAEALCFAFALGYKIKLTEDQKNENYAALVRQLETNQLITEKANQELEEKVKQRTEELLKANQKIEEKKAKEIKDFFDKKLAQAETMALRSQMNPHFLFNSLNSIKYLIQSSENKMAITYLTKFSKLVRMVLEHSKAELISLNTELEALQLYLEIERHRLGKQFLYRIDIDKKVNIESIFIPPMLLQPFVENAIWHGLLNSEKEEKTVIVKVYPTKNKNGVYCEITDNGIGREKAHLLKKNQAIPHQSFGMSLVLDRVKLFNDQSGREITIQVEDVIKNKEVSGTKIIIYL